MSKYFKKDSNAFDNYPVTEEDSVDVSRFTPSTDNLTQPLSEEKKEKLSVASQKPKEPTNTNEYIHHVEKQTEQVSHMMKDYSEQSKQELINQFEKFSPVEMFEKMNQLFFVTVDLSKKIQSLEDKIDLIFNIVTVGAKAQGINIPKQNNETQTIKDPAKLYAMQQMEEKGIDTISPQSIPKQPEEQEPQIDINEVKKKLNDIKKGKKIPNEGFTDKSVNLEEMFPNLDDEAYQAAYNAMDKIPKQTTTEEKPVPGNMKNIVGF